MNSAMEPGPRVRVCPGARSSTGAQAGENPDPAWFVPRDDGDRAVLDMWCRTVGPPAIRLTPREGGAQWRDTLRVLAWNMWIGGGDLDALLEGELGLRCGDDPADAQPFALLLQEVYRQSSDLPAPEPAAAIPFLIDPRPRLGDDVVRFADRCGLALVYVPSARNGDRIVDGVGEDKGNAILSNLVLSDPVAVEVPFEAGRKVAVGATIRGPGTAVRVVSIHLDVASTLLRTFVTGYGTRIRQAVGLARGLDLANAPFATVVGGDFNSWSERETALLRFRARYPESPPLDPTPTRGFLPTDHMFFRADPAGRLELVPGSYRVIAPVYGSDHHGRALEIRALPGPGGS